MAIDANEQIEKFQAFFDEEYKHQINDSLIAGKKFIIVDFFDLSKYDHELAEELLEQPDETIKAAEIAIAQSDLNAQLRVRFKNLPESQKCFIRNLRSTHLDKFICIEGLIRQASDVRPKVVSARFECPSCNNVITILQTDIKFREPHRCSCGRNGHFKLLSKELIDAQRVVLEELSHVLDSGGQPRKLAVFIREDLVDPRMEKRTTPGTNVRVTGVLTEIPVPTKDGGTSTTYDIVMNANFLEPIEEDFSDITIKSEDIEVIKKLAADKNIYKKLINSIAPNIYGHELIKEAVALQLFGASKKMNPDNTSTRGDIHILLVGDPGCIAGESQVALMYRGMNKIQNLGTEHLQPIREVVTKIRNSPKDKGYDFATTFHHYSQQAVLKVVTESGKEMVCTYNQPFLTKEGWKRADELFLGTKIRVMPKIPNNVKGLMPTNFERIEKSTGPLKEVSLPERFTPELAALCGYIIGDGHLNKRGYAISCYVNNEETDLIEKITEYWNNTFNVMPSVYIKNSNGSIKLIDDGNGALRQIVSTQVMHVLEINSRQIASSLAFLSSKRVPQQIFQSPKSVIASFISWLFDADGCVFANGRGRTAIQLKSRTAGLLHDVQLLFLYFGIHSRIISDNLCIRRANDMELFAKYIGFNSEKKKQKLNHLLESLKERNITQNRKVQRYEKVVKVVPAGIIDVYDFEVPDSQRFVANGIVVHNSGKSQILTFVKSNAPKVRYVAGKSASGVGLTGAIVKDEFLKGYALEAGAIVLAHKGLLAIDEMDKMSKEDTAALHEALEQQCYLGDLELTFADGSKNKIGDFVDSFMELKKDQIVNGIDCEILDLKEEIKILTTDFESISSTRIAKLSRHIAPNQFVKVKLHNGREVTVTPGHPCWIVKDGKITTISAETLTTEDFFPIPGELPIDGETQTFEMKPWKNGPQLCKLIGYHISDGCYELNRGKKNGIQFCNTNNDLIVDYKSAIQSLFDLNPGITNRGNLASVRVVSMPVANFMKHLDSNLMEKGIHKVIPDKILKCKKEDIAFLLRALFDGDGTIVNVKRNGCRVSLITENLKLAEQVTEQLLRFGIVSSIYNDRAFFKVDICGYENLLKYNLNIGFLSIKKQARLESYLLKEKTFRSISDIVPNVSLTIRDIFKILRINQKKVWGNQIFVEYNKHRFILQKMVAMAEEKVGKLLVAKESIENSSNSRILGGARKVAAISKLSISKKLGITSYMLLQHENKEIENDDYKELLLKEMDAMLLAVPKLRELKKLAFGKIRWSKIKSVEIIENKDTKWVYDVMIEPNHSFISNNMVLHNSISFAKANIQATLRCETAVLAAANPKFGRFDPYAPIASQIELPPALINRFDLLFIVRDRPDKERDSKIAHMILQKSSMQGASSEINSNLMRKYIAYAKQNVRPVLTKEALEEIKKFYVELRNSGQTGDEKVRPIPISARQLEAIVRLAEASARIRLSDKATVDDARRGINLLRTTLMEVGIDPETGQLDIDRIGGSMPASERGKIMGVRDIIFKLDEEGKRTIPVTDIFSEAMKLGIPQNKVEEAIEKLKRSGDIFQPKSGFIQRI